MRVRAFQVALSVLSGYVDAIGFATLSGSYVAFMSGNSTLLGIVSAGGASDSAALAGGLVGCFVLGVVGGTLLGGRMVRWRPVGVMLVVTALLAGASALYQGLHGLAGTMVMAVAMGAVNTVFNRPGHSAVGLTYMTGTLVRIGQRLSDALGGGSWTAVLPDALLWAGLVAGAVLGTWSFHALHVASLWVGAAVMFGMAGLARLVLPATIKE